MQTLDLEYDIDAPAGRVWSFLENFGDIEAWWPKGGPVDIERVDIEGSGIGMIRHIHNKGMPAPVSEQLDYLDPDTYTLRLSIVCDRPAGLREYNAKGRLIPTGEKSCRLVYHGEFTTEEGWEDEGREFLLAAYQLMFSGLREAAERP